MAVIPRLFMARHSAAVLVATAAAAAGLPGQPVHPLGTPCSCLRDFDSLVHHVEENYVGFMVLEDEERRRYRALRTQLREEAVTAVGDRCLDLLRALTGWFEDGHLFVLASPSPDPAEIRALAEGRERVDADEAAVRAYLDAHRESLDPLEGIWYDRGLRVGIVRDGALGTADRPGRDLVAITLAATDDRWVPGMVKAEFSLLDGVYAAVVHAGDHTRRRPERARIHRGAILRMAPYLWGKEYPVTARAQRWLDPHDPRAPAFHRLEPGIVLVSVPSHAPAYRSALQTLVETHHDALVSARTLIVDIRGNEGGSSRTTRPLAPYYATAELQPPLLPDHGPPALLASADHLAEAEENVRDNPHLPQPVLDVVAEMRRRPGELVRLPDDLFPAGPHRPDNIFSGPDRVAILMDRGVVSAGEAFVLEAARSGRVTLFGARTGGVFDTQNVKVRPLRCPERGLRIGYPEYMGGHAMAGHGINGTGIDPDIPLDAGTDWIERVLQHDR